MNNSYPQQLPQRANRWAARLLAAATVVVTASASADVITMNNGDRISGVVGNITSGQVTVTTAYAGDVVVAMASVADIQTDGTYDLTLNSGDKVSGQLVQNGLLVNGNVRPVQIEDVSLLAPPPSNDPVWTSRVDVFATFSNGNTDTQTLSILGSSQYNHGIAGRNEHRLTAFWGDAEADGTTTQEVFELDYNYRRYLRDNWFVGAYGEFFRDGLKEVNSRITVGATAGKLFWDNALGRLSAEVGIAYVFEDLGALDGGEALGRENNPALRWALNYNRFLNTTTEFYHNNEILAILGGGRGQVFNSSTGFRFNFSDQLSASIRADLRHETDPPEGAHNSDITYALGLGYSF